MCTGRPVLTALNTIPFNVQDMNYEKKNTFRLRYMYYYKIQLYF